MSNGTKKCEKDHFSCEELSEYYNLDMRMIAQRKKFHFAKRRYPFDDTGACGLCANFGKISGLESKREDRKSSSRSGK